MTNTSFAAHWPDALKMVNLFCLKRLDMKISKWVWVSRTIHSFHTSKIILAIVEIRSKVSS